MPPVATLEFDPQAAANTDPDRDGHSNKEQFHRYTDPTSASSAPAAPQGQLVAAGTQVQSNTLTRRTARCSSRRAPT